MIKKLEQVVRMLNEEASNFTHVDLYTVIDNMLWVKQLIRSRIRR